MLYAFAALLSTALIVAAGTANHDFADLFFPMLIWAAVRYGVRGTVSTLLGVMAVAVTATALGIGPFMRGTLHESLHALQRFMAVASATFVVLGAAISERTRTVVALREARGDLEVRVAERTAELRRANEALQLQGENLKQARADLELRVEARTAELTKLDEAFRAVVGACPLAILAVDRDTRFTVWNHEAERLFGMPGGAVMGKPMRSLRPEATWPEELPRALAGEALRSFEIHWSASPQGPLDLLLSTAALFDTAGNFDGVMAVIADVTEQNRMIDERLKLAAIVESSSEAIIAWDVEGMITSWNEGAVRLFHYSASEIVGRPMALLIPENRLAEALDVRMRVVQGLSLGAFETERLRRDGVRIDVSISVSPVRSSRGVIVGGSTIARDITERMRAEAERARLLEELREAVNARDALISIASHELRTPLTALQLQLQLLAKQHGDSRVLPAVVGQAGRLARLINNLLEVSRITAGTLQLETAEVDLTRMAEDVVAHYRAEVRGTTSHRRRRRRGGRGPLGSGATRADREQPRLERGEVRRGKAGRGPGRAQRRDRQAHGDRPRHRDRERGPGAHLRALRTSGLRTERQRVRAGPVDRAADRRRDAGSDQRREHRGGGVPVHGRAAATNGLRDAVAAPG